jgi:peptidoglycan LD-endopeptidase CwlK
VSYVLSKRSEEILGTVHPHLKTRMLRVYVEMYDVHGVSMEAHSGLRAFSEQEANYRKGRDENGNVVDPAAVVTNAKPGNSWHEFALAIDSVFRGKDPYGASLPERDRKLLWDEFGRLCVKHGLEWGGDWNGNGIKDKNDWDLCHAQARYGISLIEAKQLYRIGGLQLVFETVDNLLRGENA